MCPVGPPLPEAVSPRAVEVEGPCLKLSPTVEWEAAAVSVVLRMARAPLLEHSRTQ